MGVADETALTRPASPSVDRSATWLESVRRLTRRPESKAAPSDEGAACNGQGANLLWRAWTSRALVDQ